MKIETLIVKVTIPRLIVDNPMCLFQTRNKKFSQEIPINQTMIKWMKGKHEAFFELKMSMLKIISMQPATEKEYYESPGPEADDVSRNKRVRTKAQHTGKNQ